MRPPIPRPIHAAAGSDAAAAGAAVGPAHWSGSAEPITITLSSVVWLVALGALALVCFAAAAASPPDGTGTNRQVGYAIGLFLGSLLAGAIIRSAWVRLRGARRPDLAVRSPWIAVIALVVALIANGPALARNLPASGSTGSAAATPSAAPNGTPTAIAVPSAPTGIDDLLRIGRPYSTSALSATELSDLHAFYDDDPDVRAFDARRVDGTDGTTGLLIVIDVGVTPAELVRWQSATERDAVRSGLAHERRTLGGRVVLIVELEDDTHLAAWGVEPYFVFLYTADAQTAGAMATAILEPG